MTPYFVKPGTKKYVEGYGLLSFARNLSGKYGKKNWILLQKQDKMMQKIASKTVVHKTDA